MLKSRAIWPRVDSWHLLVAVFLGGLVCPALWGADPSKPPERHPTRILARFRDPPATATPASASALASAGVQVSKHIGLVPGLVVLDEVSMARAASVGAASTDLDQRIAALRRTGLFSYVEPDYQVSISALPADLRFTDGTLWGLRNTGQNGGVAGIDIDATRAWQITTGSPDVIVAVVDTGIDYTHTELRDQMWRNPGEIPENGLDDDSDGFVDDVFGINTIDPARPPYDDHDHGTHVAGTIGAAANDGFPHVGVAWQARLMACKFLTAQGYGYNSDAVTCIDYATRHGASIINASWGGGEYTQALVDSIAAAGEAGILFVAAAGNSGLDLQSELGEHYPNYPAGYDLDTILSVAAIDRRGALTSFSNFGRFSVDVGAPGDEVFSSVARLGKNGYGTFRGTSMAAPHAAGVAALARARHPDLTAHELKALLLHSATPTPGLSERTVTGGRVNAFNAVSSSADGRLELAWRLPDSHVAFAGRALRVAVYITDLHERPGARVTGQTTGAPLMFLDDGVLPDDIAGDAVYTAWVPAPDDATTLTVTAHAEFPGSMPVDAEITLPLLQPPGNDAFADATPIVESAVNLYGSTNGATVEHGEPQHAGLQGGSSVWWKWIAPVDVEVMMEIRYANVDTIVAVYTGSELDALTEVAKQGETPSPYYTNRVTFHAQAGTTYLIAVDAWNGAAGEFVLTFLASLAAPNDAFADAIPLNGDSVRLVSTTLGSTLEPDEPPSPNSTGGSVWYSWTARRPSVVMIDISSWLDGQDAVEVYTGTSVSSLTKQRNLAWSILGPAWTRYRLQAVPGETYHIAIRAVGEPAGVFELALDTNDSPPNDAFAGRIALAGDDITVPVDNRGATPEPLDPKLWDESSFAREMPVASVWYSWTAPRDGTAWVRMPFNGFFSTLAAYTGDGLGALTNIAVGYQSYLILFTPWYGNHMMFPVRAGETYTIMVGGVEGSTSIGTMFVTLLTPPPNTHPADAIAITENTVEVNSSNIGATEPLWWSWTAPASGAAAVNISSADFHPVVSVSMKLPGGTLPIEQPMPDFTRTVFEAVRGTTYLLSVDTDPSGRNLPGLAGADGLHGTFQMSLTLDLSPQDNPARTAVLVGEAVTSSASNRASMPRTYDYGFGTGFLYAPLWWSWTAPTSGPWVISTTGTDFNTLMGVFSSEASWPTQLLAYNDDAKPGRLYSEVTLDAQAGATYHILVDTHQIDLRRPATGNIPLSIRRVAAPANDDFSHRAILDPADPRTAGSNIGATAESAEPHHAFIDPEHSIWWTWTAPESGLYIASTAGSTFDTTVGVYTGDSIDSLRWVSANDDGPGPGQTSLAVFRAIAGVSYHLAVDGYSGATGNVALSVLPFDRPSISVLVPVRPMPPGDPLHLVADVRGRGPYSFQWYRNGVAIPGATDMSLTIPMLQQFHAGAYTLVITSPSGPTTAGPFSIEVADPGPSTSSVVNLSTRALCRGGDDVLIPGFVISGAGTRRILMRAIGPELATLGVGHPLVDPSFVVMRREAPGHVEIGRNDDWADDTGAVTIDTVTLQVHAFPLDAASASSALVMDLPAGAYTVIAQGRPGQSGIALVELYDAGSGIVSPGDTARITNLSNRGYAADGEDVMIPGFVIEGSGTRTFLLRAVGPGLTALGLNGALPDPSLLVFRHDNASAQLILQNDSWGENGEAADVAAIATSLGAFALEPGSLDAAMVVTLPPGIYTAHARGAPGSNGIVLVELYLVP